MRRASNLRQRALPLGERVSPLSSGLDHPYHSAKSSKAMETHRMGDNSSSMAGSTPVGRTSARNKVVSNRPNPIERYRIPETLRAKEVSNSSILPTKG